MSWVAVTRKPQVFPPADHVHPLSQFTDLFAKILTDENGIVLTDENGFVLWSDD